MAQLGNTIINGSLQVNGPISNTDLTNTLNSKVAKNNQTDAIGLINSLSAGEAAATLNDNVQIITQNTDTSKTDYYRRSVSKMYDYIKGKASGDWGINITGTANRLIGFSSAKAELPTWGTLTSANGYTAVMKMDTTSGGGIAFADKSSQTSLQVDGSFYQGEGKNKVMDVTGGTFTGAVTFNTTVNLNGIVTTGKTAAANGTTPGTSSRLLIYGPTYGNDSANIKTAGTISYGDGGPQIIFNTQNSTINAQPVAIIYSDNDSVGSGAGLSVVTNSEGNSAYLRADRLIAKTQLDVLSGTTTLGGITKITNNTSATNTTTGALVVTGGIATNERVWANGFVATNNALYVGHNTTANAIIYLNQKKAIKGTDNWLRINEDKQFTSGTFFGSNIVRTDGELQIGDNGSYFKAANGSVYSNGYIKSNTGDFKLIDKVDMKYNSTDNCVEFIWN